MINVYKKKVFNMINEYKKNCFICIEAHIEKQSGKKPKDLTQQIHVHYIHVQ